jgi:hypothetical protein
VARRQLSVVTAKNQEIGVSNEVVAYDSAAQAAKALSQLRTSVTTCKTTVFHKSAVKGAPLLRYSDNKVTTAKNLPVKDNAVASSLVTPKRATGHLYVVLIFQRRGTVLTGVYLNQLTKPTAADLKALHLLAAATGKRLAAI